MDEDGGAGGYRDWVQRRTGTKVSLLPLQLITAVASCLMEAVEGGLIV